MKILIDTNIFLDFYRSNNQTLEILEQVIENSDRIILTDQIIQEFDRNREIVIKEISKNFKSESKLENFSSSFLRNLTEFQELIEIQRNFKAKQSEIISQINKILEDPTTDEIAESFKTLVNKSIENNYIYYANEQTIQKAQKRKLVGNPPSSNDKHSIGDEINWEIVLENVKEDIVIVGRDNTYNNLDFLRKDFRKNTGRFLIKIFDKITDALNEIGVSTNPTLNAAEQQFVQEISHYSEFWKYQDV